MFHKFWIDIKTVIEIFHILQIPLQRYNRLQAIVKTRTDCVLTTAICNQEQTKIRIKTVIMNTTI